MLYKFKSKAAGDVIMLEATGAKVLAIVGKDASPKGILLVSEMPHALAALQAAIRQEEAQQKADMEAANAAGQHAPSFDAVSLRQRVKPFADLLQRSHRADADVVWGV